MSTTESDLIACPVCAATFAPRSGQGHPRRYCSTKCKQRASTDRRRNQLRLLPEYPAPPRPPKRGLHRVGRGEYLTRDGKVYVVRGSKGWSIIGTAADGTPVVTANTWRTLRDVRQVLGIEVSTH